MKSKVMPSEKLGARLNAWNHSLLEQDFEKAEAIHQSIAHMFSTLIEDDHHHLLYQLLEVRMHLMMDQSSLARACLANIYPHRLDTPLLYYYHFFKGMILCSEKNYLEALSYYKTAEKYLVSINDHLEKAEFYYQFSGVYYFIVHTWESINYLRKAKTLYAELNGFEKRKAGCSVGLGLNLIDIKQYEQAEVELLQALDIAVSTEDKKLKAYVYHNLGLFYSNQNLSSIAIRYLKETENAGLDEKHSGYLKNIFLLAQEYCKLNNIDEALPYYEKGTQYSHDTYDKEYEIKFKIIHALYLQEDASFLQKALMDGIEYFQKSQMWVSVQWYSEMLAEMLFKEKRYKKAASFYALFIDCNKKINEMGALK